MTFRAKADVTVTALDDELVLFDVRGSMLYTLNAVGALVWTRLSEADSTAAELVNAVTDEFDVRSGTARLDVERLLADLMDAGLVTPLP